MGNEEIYAKLDALSGSLEVLTEIINSKVPEELLTEKEMLKLLKLGRTKFVQLIKSGEFAGPDLFHPRRWRISTYMQWLTKNSKNKRNLYFMKRKARIKLEHGNKQIKCIACEQTYTNFQGMFNEHDICSRCQESDLG